MKDRFPHALVIISSNTVEGTDSAAFNKWYNEIHMPDMLTLDEVVSARRYQLASPRMNPGMIQDPQHEYVAIYRLNAETEEDLHKALEKMHELGGKGISAGPFDYGRTSVSFLLSVSDHMEADPNYVPSYMTGKD